MATLYVIATPIGNLDDLSYRAARVLGETAALACEDTRQTRKIFSRYEIPSPRTIFSCHEHNETQSRKRIVGLLETGQNVAFCTDGGYPGISDPGYRVIEAVIEAGHTIEVIPGASAVSVALVVSGLSMASYTFKGFPPRKPGPRKRFLETDRDLPHTLVLFESPFRVYALLVDALAVLGNRRAALCIELTKKFEEVRRGYLEELAGEFANKPIKGEVTIVIAGNNPKFSAPQAERNESEP